MTSVVIFFFFTVLTAPFSSACSNRPTFINSYQQNIVISQNTQKCFLEIWTIVMRGMEKIKYSQTWRRDRSVLDRYLSNCFILFVISNFLYNIATIAVLYQYRDMISYQCYHITPSISSGSNCLINEVCRGTTTC